MNDSDVLETDKEYEITQIKTKNDVSEYYLIKTILNTLRNKTFTRVKRKIENNST